MDDFDPGAVATLHEAARNYDSKQLLELLENDSFADPNEEDENGRLPIHVLLNDEFHGHLNENDMQDCLAILIQHGGDVNARETLAPPPLSQQGTAKPNLSFLARLKRASPVKRCWRPRQTEDHNEEDIGDDGETPLSLAVDKRFEAAALLLVKHGADTAVRTKKFNEPHSLVSAIAEKMPDVMLEIFDRGVTLDKDKVKLDWSPILQYPKESEIQTQRDASENIRSSKKLFSRKENNVQRETSFLYSLLDTDTPLETRIKYLKHPLIMAFLFLRRSKASSQLLLLQLATACYPILYMSFVYFMYFYLCKFEEEEDEDDDATTTTSSSTNRNKLKRQSCSITAPVMFAAYFLATVVVGSVLLEIYMLLRIDWKYLNSWRAWVFRASIITMGFTLWPALQFDTLFNISWQYPIAALATFFAWILFLLQLELVPEIKVYLELVATVTLSVLSIVLVFLPFLIGFYMGFTLMFFDSPGIMNFILMTVDVGGTEDMIETVKDEHWWFLFMSEVFGTTFIVVIAIVFMNLLLGTSINDIQELKNSAEIMNESHQVQKMFVINLIFPYAFNVVSEENVEQTNWYNPNRNPNDEEEEEMKKDGEIMLPKNIRISITELLKSKPSLLGKTSSSAEDSRISLKRDSTCC